MKLTFEKLGPLDKAEIELADLTIISGENNKGKTYVTYLVHCLLDGWISCIDLDLKKDLEVLQNKGVVVIDLEKLIEDHWEDLCKKAIDRLITKFKKDVGLGGKLFSELELKLELPLGKSWRVRLFEDKLKSAKNNILVAMSKPANSCELELTAIGSDRLEKYSIQSLGFFITERLLKFMSEEFMHQVFISSTERTGATTFRKQLNLANNKIIELLNKSSTKGSKTLTPHEVFETMFYRPDYSLAVKHNVEFLNQLPESNVEDGDLNKAVPDLLKRFESMVSGKYVTNKEGVTYFQPARTKLKLGLGEVSSSVRSLLIVWYWLKYSAKKGDMLMIDEPELNLHPASQRRLARFIVALVNSGIRVFITTHSDYIIKEFNTLIMLNQENKNFDNVRSKFKDYLPEDKLSHDKVAFYMTSTRLEEKEGSKKRVKINTLIKAKVTSTLGIEAEIFNKTIDEMNSIQEAIYYA